MLLLYSVELHLPADKLPGYYAQIIKGIADIVTLIDRHKTLLFVSSAADADAIETFVQHYKVNCERGLWLQLDDDWTINERTFTDYGLITREGNRFIDVALTAVVTISGDAPESELEQALQQTDEHTLAQQTKDGRRLLAVDRHHIELLEGIARAYHCHAEPLQLAPETL
ncbi:hypothetical protein Back11_25890 [Paenibacillus baekrokdamisoli]|uniref:Uncharacterized protein n=2 Tax=Paenibacillus baekrokdamisoli TaxID=1712516 RepID=A0A3G9JDL4_9BACL|nr:hypothetical protein Back11_25890 [Paenibacillus baekrokdamisoli]